MLAVLPSLLFHMGLPLATFSDFQKLVIIFCGLVKNLENALQFSVDFAHFWFHVFAKFWLMAS